MIVPLTAGRPFFRFRVTLSERNFIVFVKWSVRFEFYSVDIYEGEDAVILGRGLHTGIDLLYGLNLDIGTLVLDGAPPTVTNLGLSNKLVYTPQ
jgi:hypothetical protein